MNLNFWLVYFPEPAVFVFQLVMAEQLNVDEETNIILKSVDLHQCDFALFHDRQFYHKINILLLYYKLVHVQ